jgi:hypothetical protein
MTTNFIRKGSSERGEFIVRDDRKSGGGEEEIENGEWGNGMGMRGRD